MNEPVDGWAKPGPTKRRWYHYLLIALAAVVGGLCALMVGTVIFFGLIAGW